MLTLPTVCLLAALTSLPQTSAALQQCTAGQQALFDYSAVFAPEHQASHAAFRDLPGFTRSAYKANYALVTPESRVWLPHDDWPGCKTSHVISRATPAHFSMFFVDMKARTCVPPAWILTAPATVCARQNAPLMFRIDAHAAALPPEAAQNRACTSKSPLRHCFHTRAELPKSPRCTADPH